MITLYMIYLNNLTFIDVLCLLCNSNTCIDSVSSQVPMHSAYLSLPSVDMQNVILNNDNRRQFKR